MTRKALSYVWLAGGAALLVWVIARNDPRGTLLAFREALAHPGLLAVAAAAFLATQVGFLVKWHLLSHQAGAPFTFRQSLHLFGTLTLVGLFTPGRAGELAVPMMMRGGGKMTGVALVNRLLESSCTLCAGVLAALLVLDVKTFGGSLKGLGLVMLLFAAAIVTLSRRRHIEAILGLVRACLKPLRRLRAVEWLFQQEEKRAHEIEHFYQANERLLAPGPIFFFGLLMLLVWTLMVSGNWCLIQATVPPDSKPVTVAVVVAIIAVMAVAMFVSPIPGGLGLSEFASVAVFAQLGYVAQQFVPFLLLARVGVYLAVIALYLASRLAGQPLGAPEGAPAAG